MSADNGIYILATPKGDGFEYRVEHLQSIDNYMWDHDLHCDTDDKDIWIKNAREMWKGCEVLESQIDALKLAEELLEQEYICEYGISFISIRRKF